MNICEKTLELDVGKLVEDEALFSQDHVILLLR